MPTDQPRRRAGWPVELSAAVDAALKADPSRPPVGLSGADWERVLHARRQEAGQTVAQLRVLGPELEADQVLLTTDEVLTRTPEQRRFWELRTARIVTPEGARSLSGSGDSFLLLLLVMASIPNYRQRRQEQQYIGSGQVEKANDLLVAQRQKERGMHWSLETSDALTALRTLMLNGGGDRYWRDHEVLPLVAT